MARPTAASIAADTRLRFDQILNSPEGMRNPELAKKLAFGTMDVPEALDYLASAPAANPYFAAMEREAIGIAPAGPRTTPFATAATTAKEARLAEIEGAARAHNVRMGYIKPEAR